MLQFQDEEASKEGKDESAGKLEWCFTLIVMGEPNSNPWVWA
jgi:hypothetical protein